MQNFSLNFGLMAITKQSHEKGNLMFHSNTVSTNLHITQKVLFARWPSQIKW